jgi:hypothetical protein
VCPVIYALFICGFLAPSPGVFADTAVLVMGSNVARGDVVPQILLPDGKMLDVAGSVRELRDIRYFKGDILFRDVTTGERLNLSFVTWLSLTELLADPARYGVLIYDPDLRKLVAYNKYVATLGIGAPTLSLVLEKSGTIGVIPDDTFLRPKAFSFARAPSDSIPPSVTPPAAITIPATQSTGALPSASPALAAFLAAGSASDAWDPSPIRLSPQVGGVDVTSSTLFPTGITTVTFRYKDHSNNTASATSTVTVILGQPRLTGTISGKGWNSKGILYLDLTLTNTGSGNARNISIASLPLRALLGTGVLTLNSPALPIAVGNIDVGGSIVLRLLLNVPATITRFSITETGSVQDVAGTKFSFSMAQAVIP